MPKLADIHSCSGCLSCVDSCNTGALFSRWNEEGHLTYGLKLDKCVECHRCERNCPAVNGYQHGSNELSLSTPYAVWCKDSDLRARSTSGGVFAALAVAVIAKGGVVVGATMQNSIVRHIVIDNAEDIHLLQGSKYTQSDTTGIYKEVYEYLKRGTLVLFSGLGCQVAGLLNFLPHNKQFDNLFTIDLICGGVPSRHIIDLFLDHEKDIVLSISSFRNKTEYELSVNLLDGTKKVVPLSERPLPLCGFYTELTNKQICYNCKYVGATRKSDITIGDLWGDKDYLDEHKNGLSVAVVHSKRAEQLLTMAEIEMHKIAWNGFLMNNPRMVYGKSILGLSKERKALSKISNMDYQQILELFANAAFPNHPFSYVNKVLRVLRIEYNHKVAIKFVKTLLSK